MIEHSSGVNEASLAKRIAALALQCSRTADTQPDPGVPFAHLGLDSIGSIELAAAIEDELGIEVPLDLVSECADARTLAARLELRQDEARPTRDDALASMLLDAVLPEDVYPPSLNSRRSLTGLQEARRILLTGASGFLGGWLAAELLRTSDARLICLVRPLRHAQGKTWRGHAADRLRARLLACGAEAAAIEKRVSVVDGDLSLPMLGLSTEAISILANHTDAVCHAGAVVNWVQPYRALRATNVAGTTELLRLACVRGRPFHFVSSLSTCYSTGAPNRVDERYEALAHVDGIHLGYAQSKAVAEALVAEAGRRGLPVTIYRPSLIAGHSATGEFNADDLLSLLVKGCVEMGCAPDLDWTLDALPVDVVARDILARSSARGTVHLLHPRPRHWRECVLWMRLYGYPLTLLPYHGWLQRLAVDLRTAAGSRRRHPLAPIEHLLFDRPEGAKGFTIPELYEDSRRAQVTRRYTPSRSDGECIDLDAHLLNRYFDAFVSANHLPPPPSPASAIIPNAGPSSQMCASFDVSFFARALAHGAHGSVTAATRLERGSAESILGELTTWRSPKPTGVFRYALDTATEGETCRRDVLLKVKARDTDAIAVGNALSGLCDARIGRAYAHWSDRLGLSMSHIRELAIYAQTDERFTTHAPVLLGSIRDDEAGVWAVVLEYLTDGSLLDTVNAPQRWTPCAIDTAVAGMSRLHAIWYGRRDELARQPWIGWIHTAAGVTAMSDLWDPLAHHARSSFCGWTDASMWTIHRTLVARIEEWWPHLEAQTATLIHNDFNPRNVCLRPAGQGVRLCAYDWELATVGAPQRDLAEFLCFVLTPDTPDDRIDRWIGRHRVTLERETGVSIDRTTWRTGFAAALYDVLVTRLTMYALIDRVRRQPFLPRIVRTWRRLYDRFPLERVA
jgi:thioester reductase-like protein